MLWHQFSCLILIKKSLPRIAYYSVWTFLFRKQLKLQTFFISQSFILNSARMHRMQHYLPWGVKGMPCFANFAAIFCCTLFLIDSPKSSFPGPLPYLALVLVLPLPDPPPVTMAAPLDEQMDADPLLLPLPHFTVHSVVRPLSPGIVNTTQ